MGVAKDLADGLEPITIAVNRGLPLETVVAAMSHPRAAALVHNQLQKQFHFRLRPVAQKAALELMEDPTAPHMVKARLALGVMDHARRIEEFERTQAGGARTIESMTTSELENHVQALEAELSGANTE